MGKIFTGISDHFMIFGFLLSCFFQGGSCQSSPEENPYRHIAKLDPEGNYVLEWLTNMETRTVLFNVTVKTTGYIGFGLSIRGQLDGADIVIGGVDPSGQPYLTDRHGRDGGGLELDTNQDWILHDAWERESTTFLSFSRPFDTCDEQDLAITDDMLNIIWTFGETDAEILNFESRGALPVYLLDPDIVPRSIDERVPEQNRGPPILDNSVQLFNMTTTISVPAQDTLYWCKFHKVPTSTKHHIIGFNTAFPTEKDKRHVHHLVMFRCNPPPGVDPDTLFDAESPGHECYFPRIVHPSNSQYCTEYTHLFAVGSRPIFFPDHAGMPMSASGPEYFLLQTHYDNPESEANLQVTYSLEAYYTSNLRENDVGMMLNGIVSPGATHVIIPPNSVNHTIRGHCAPGCTEQTFPEEGINVFAAFLHTHISGVAAKYQHFRGNRELPWILKDDNYDFSYQQYRVLREERKIFPGDLLIYNCVINTTPRNGTAVVGGFSTREEMCTAFLWYYSRSPAHSFCRSELRTEEYKNLVGVNTTQWDQSRREMLITSPLRYQGVSMAEYANNYINWSSEMGEELQRHHLFDRQVSNCYRFTPDAVGTEPFVPREGVPFESENGGDGPTSVFPTNTPSYQPPPSQCNRNSNRVDSNEKESGARGWSRN